MKVLVVVDMQNDFITGSLGTKQAVAIVPKDAKKIKNFDGYIYATMDTHQDDYLHTQEGKNLPIVHCVEGTAGWEMHPSIEKAFSERKADIVTFFKKDAFGSKDLVLDLLSLSEEYDVEEIELVGLCTDICVISNALMLKSWLPETKITVDASCCAGVTPMSHENALNAMRACQINIENEEEENHD